MRTRSWLMSALPTGSPRPQTTFATPAGSSSASAAASLSSVSGVSSEGFSTSVLPAAIAGAIFQAAIISG
jgi:hypothetical protein